MPYNRCMGKKGNILKISLPAVFLIAAAVLSGCGDNVTDTQLMPLSPACVQAEQADIQKIDSLYTRFEQVTGSQITREDKPSFRAEVLKFGETSGAHEQMTKLLTELIDIRTLQLDKLESAAVGICYYDDSHIRMEVLTDLIMKYDAWQMKLMFPDPPEGPQQDDGLLHDGKQAFPDINAPRKLHI